MTAGMVNVEEARRNYKQNVEDVDQLLGKAGLWHFGIIALLCYYEILAGTLDYETVFLVPNVNYQCVQDVPKNGNIEGTTCTLNSTGQECARLEFDRTYFDRTIVEELNLVCDKKWLISFSKTIAVLGNMLAFATFGYIADRIGRRNLLLLANIPALLGVILTYFPNNYPIFAFSRLFGIGGSYGACMICYVIAVEAFGSSQRHWLMITRLWFGTGGIFLSSFAYFQRDWFYIHSFCTALVLGQILVSLLVPESPKWLIATLKAKEAGVALRQIMVRDKRQEQDIEMKINQIIQVKQLEKSERQSNFLDVLRKITSKQLRWRVISASVVWILSAFVQNALILNTSVFGEEPFFSFMYMQATFAPASIISLFSMKRFGGRITVLVSSLIATGFTVAAAITTNSHSQIYFGLIIAVKVFLNTAYNAMYTYTGELFPTVVRSSAVGVSTTMGRVAVMMSPFAKEMASATSVTAVTWFFASITMALAIIVWFMPNTHMIELAENMEEENNEEDNLVNKIRLNALTQNDNSIYHIPHWQTYKSTAAE